MHIHIQLQTQGHKPPEPNHCDIPRARPVTVGQLPPQAPPPVAQLVPDCDNGMYGDMYEGMHGSMNDMHGPAARVTGGQIVTVRMYVCMYVLNISYGDCMHIYTYTFQ